MIYCCPTLSGGLKFSHQESFMPVLISGVDTLKEYILGVMERAEDHAHNVDEVCLAVAGAIVWRGDRITVRQYEGATANVLWMEIGERRYAFSFNHSTGYIEVRLNSVRGPVIQEFHNGNTHAEVKAFFAGL